MNLILLGLPGAGKGTQANKISSEYNLPHISTGEIFREQIKKGTILGEKAKHYIDAGRLVPDELTIDMVRKRFSEGDLKQGFVLDGFPRTINQAEALQELMIEEKIELDLVLYIKADDAELLRRLSGRRVCAECGATYHLYFNPPEVEGVCDLCGGRLIQRKDDREEAVKIRLKASRARVEVLTSFYAEKGLLKPIESDGIEMVFARIREAIEVSQSDSSKIPPGDRADAAGKSDCG